MSDARGNAEAHIEVRDLTMSYGDFVIQKNLNFTVRRGDIFIIMGGSGCGKSTLLKVMIGLKSPSAGDVRYEGEAFWAAGIERQEDLKRKFGTLFQGGALWSGMTLAENVALPLKQYTKLSDAEIRELCAYKLALVGLAGFEDFYPSEISGGMKKRAGLARAMAMDPGHPVLRRTVRRARPDQREAARRSHSRTARQPRHDGGDRHARARQHLLDRQQLGVSRSGHEDPARHRRSEGTARSQPELRRPQFSDARHRRAGGVAYE